MATLCPACSRANPANASYCYYDGCDLSQKGLGGPLKLGTIPFPSPFCFADGQACANFNQLSLACDERWDEAKRLLADGIWPAFFGTIGRLDLAEAAKQAAREPDLDVGLGQLLEKLPADPKLRSPELALSCTEANLGTRTPGTDHRFELVIMNQGKSVLRGRVMACCDWLSIGDRTRPSSLKMFQTRDMYSLTVHVLGDKLRAGLKPLEGEIAIDTNGGTITLPVRAVVPVQPFPSGRYTHDVLAGAKSPRELAVKANAHPQEAAVLFERGAVKAWYATNGWTYPVRATQASGKAAVQQFFEALGLTKPPPLEIDTAHLRCKGKIGQRLTKHVTISTKEPRPVYAQASSNQQWIKAGPGKSQGNKVTIPLQIEVPSCPGETINAQVTIQGNGNQQFVVPVTVAVLAAGPDVDAEPVKPTKRRSLGCVLAGVGLLLVIAAGVGALVLDRGEIQRWVKTILKRDKGGEKPKEEEEQRAEQVRRLVADGQAHLKAGRLDLADKSFAEASNLAPNDPAVLQAQHDLDQARKAADVAAGRKPQSQQKAWWDGISDTDFPALVEALKKSAPEAQAVFDSLAVTSDTKRRDAYKALAEKLPELVRNANAKEPLGRLLADCYVFEPYEPNTAQLGRALTSLIPQKNTEFRPEAKGEEVDLGFWSLQVIHSALSHKRIPPDRVKLLAGDLDTVFWPELETAFPPDKLKAQTEKLLAERCYHNTRPTAATLFEHAVTMRDRLIKEFPQHLAPAFRAQVDVAWFAIDLSKENAAWSKIAPILQSCLDTNDVMVLRKVVDHYEKANPATAEKLDKLLAEKWKVAANPKLTQAAKVKAIKTRLSADTSPAERRAQLQNLISSALSAAKPGQEKEQPALLQDAVRLAHTSTTACALYHKDSSLERFDELVVAKIPEVDQAEPGKKPPPGDPKKPAADAGAQSKVIEGQLNAKSTRARDNGEDWLFNIHNLPRLKAGQDYTIDLVSRDFRADLRVLDPKNNRLEVAPFRVGLTTQRMFFQAPMDGVYQVSVATRVLLLQLQGPVDYKLRFQVGKPANPFLVPGGGGLVPGGVEVPPKANDEKDAQLDVSKLINDLNNKESKVRIAAFNKLAGTDTDDLPPLPARRIAKYLLSIPPDQKDELDAVTAKLDSFSKCLHLLQRLDDYIKDEVGKKDTTEAVLGKLLGQPRRFALTEDWRLEWRKLLLQRVLDLTESPMRGADQAADILRDLYKDQGKAFGIEDPNFLALTRPTQVLESVIKHVAARVAKQNLPAKGKDDLERIGRDLQVARFLAENDLEHMVRLQRIWIKVLAIHLREQAPAKAESMVQVQKDFVDHDQRSSGLIDQLRAGEEKILRIWALAHDLK